MTAGETVPLRYRLDTSMVEFTPIGGDPCSIQLSITFEDDSPLDQEVFKYLPFD